MENVVARAERRAIRAWLDDGLAELGFGLVCLTYVVVFVGLHRYPALLIIFPIAGYLGATRFRALFEWAKRRFADRRSGSVRYPQSSWWQSGARVSTTGPAFL